MRLSVKVVNGGRFDANPGSLSTGETEGMKCESLTPTHPESHPYPFLLFPSIWVGSRLLQKIVRLGN